MPSTKSGMGSRYRGTIRDLLFKSPAYRRAKRNQMTYQDEEERVYEAERAITDMLKRHGFRKNGFRKLRSLASLRIQKPPKRRFKDPRKKELKFFDHQVQQVPLIAGTIHDSFNLITQGTGESQRIGRAIVIMRINWRYRIKLASKALATDSTDSVRIILFIDTQCNGAVATVADILESPNWKSFKNLTNTSRFRTLMDRQYNLVSPGALNDATLEDSIDDTFYKDVNIPIDFTGNTGTISDILSNNISRLLISSDGLSLVTENIRLRFSA